MIPSTNRNSSRVRGDVGLPSRTTTSLMTPSRSRNTALARALTSECGPGEWDHRPGAARPAHAVNHRHRGPAVIRRSPIRSSFGHGAHELRPFIPPGGVRPVEGLLFKSRRSAFGIPDRRHEPFRPVAPSQPLDAEGAEPPEDFQREEILPLGPTRVHARDSAARIPKEPEGVVFERAQRPDGRLEQGKGVRREAGEPVEEVGDMHPLIRQLTPAGQLRVPSPLLLIPGPSPVAGPRPDVDDLPDGPFGEAPPGFPDRWMIPMVEPDLQDA